jgi:SAM-dependent methyltransferase
VKAVAEVVADFDAIAAALAKLPLDDRLSLAEMALFRAIPDGARTGIDVGCGHGVFTRAAAAHGVAMLGVDLSSQMIALARARTPARLDVEYRVADILNPELGPNEFDIVAALNVAHHLPLEVIVPRLASLVAPGGQLLLQDLLDRPGARYLPINCFAVAYRQLRRLVRPEIMSRKVRRLYARHGAGERYLTPAEVGPTYQHLLPGARVVHHLEWRYSVIWTRPLLT